MGSNNTEIFSVSEIDEYSTRLHFNTAADVGLNVVAGYLVLRHSTPAMGNYKYYIFSTIVLTLIMDIHLTVIYGMYTFLPSTMFCAAGLARNWGWFWGQTFNYVSSCGIKKRGIGVWSCPRAPLPGVGNLDRESRSSEYISPNSCLFAVHSPRHFEPRRWLSFHRLRLSIFFNYGKQPFFSQQIRCHFNFHRVTYLSVPLPRAIYPMYKSGSRPK